jgi:hypothetical protein
MDRVPLQDSLPHRLLVPILLETPMEQQTVQHTLRPMAPLARTIPTQRASGACPDRLTPSASPDCPSGTTELDRSQEMEMEDCRKRNRVDA